MTRSLIILPDDSAQPVLDAIHGATTSLRVKMFAFSHQPLLDAIVAAHQRGVLVKVMLNPVRRDGETDNDGARDLLQQCGIQVTESSPSFDALALVVVSSTSGALWTCPSTWKSK